MQQRRVLAVSASPSLLMMVVVLCAGLIVTLNPPAVEAVGCHDCTAQIESHCPKLTTCRYGTRKEPRTYCGCCDVCAKGPGEECGGALVVKGVCANGYDCVSPPYDYIQWPVGKCVRKA